MVGIQGSGKTTLTRMAFPRHTHISLDANKKDMKASKRRELILRYESECDTGEEFSLNRKAEYVMIQDALRKGENVVVDNTNISAKERGPYIRLARRFEASVKAIYFTNTDGAYTRNAARETKGEKCLESYVLDETQSRRDRPQMREGFDFIQELHW